jgi:HlyD family secretion protein
VGGERITVARVSYGTFHEYIPVTGNVVPLATVYLDAVEGGQVTDVFVEEGALVNAGDALVRLKNTGLQLEVIGAEAQLTEQLNYLATNRLTFEQSRLARQRELLEIQYQLDLAERHLAQLRPLVATGGVAQSEVDDLEATLTYYRGLEVAVRDAQAVDAEFQATQMASMDEALGVMNANLDIARENLNDLTIIAPIDGQLTLLEAEVGESKAPGVRIGQVDQVNAFKVTALVDEFYLSRVVIGQRATAEIAGDEYVLELTKVYPGVQNRQFEVDLAFGDRVLPNIRRGQTLRLRLEIGAPAETLVLANGAFFDDTGGQWAFVMAPSGDVAERREVRLGRRNPDGIEGLGGLDVGDTVITSSYQQMLDFDRIQIRRGDGG